MARTVNEIKAIMTNSFISDETIMSDYDLQPGDTFDARFSKVSIENIIFYIVAFCMWTLEVLFDAFSADVTARIDEIIPHRAKWYRDKALKFMKNKTLIPDSDEYDTTGMEDSDIDAAHVIKHAITIESNDASILIIKIAGESNNERSPVDSNTETQFAEYISEIKDAGVRISIVNAEADKFNCEVDIYYDAVLLPYDVEIKCREKIKNYIENLPFNGEYSNMKFVDELQAIEGVKIVEFKSATYLSVNNSISETINAKVVPFAGYFKINNVVLNMNVYNI
ncbi:MAG: hypothetical protein LBT56_08820 [Prevotellaceae bacterium]|jgi:hypothetical protein|nr:hypothetical protein [Prevotellaceae bacterium]